jgi:hypothetical protein
VHGVWGLFCAQGAFEGINAVAFTSDAKLVLAAENNKASRAGRRGAAAGMAAGPHAAVHLLGVL